GEAIVSMVRLASPYETDPTKARSARVIGVVGDAVVGFIGERKDHPAVYEAGAVTGALETLILRTRSGAEEARRELQRTLADIDPGGSIEMHTLEESLAVQVYPVP